MMMHTTNQQLEQTAYDLNMIQMGLLWTKILPIIIKYCKWYIFNLFEMKLHAHV